VVSEALLSLGTVYCSWAATVDATMTPMEKNQSFFIVKIDKQIGLYQEKRLDSMLKLSPAFFFLVCLFLDVFCNVDVIEKENHG
jgi:hypothetical protein